MCNHSSDDFFIRFLKDVDKLCTDKYGLSIHDFPDYMWRDEYDSEVPPEDAFDEWEMQGAGDWLPDNILN